MRSAGVGPSPAPQPTPGPDGPCPSKEGIQAPFSFAHPISHFNCIAAVEQGKSPQAWAQFVPVVLISEHAYLAGPASADHSGRQEDSRVVARHGTVCW